MSSSLTTSVAVETKITVMRGDTFNPIMKFWQDAAKTVKLVLTDYSFKMQVRDKNGAEIIAFTSEASGGITIQNENELAFEADMDVVSGTYRYDLQMTADDIIKTLIKGDFVILTDVTV